MEDWWLASSPEENLRLQALVFESDEECSGWKGQGLSHEKTKQKPTTMYEKRQQKKQKKQEKQAEEAVMALYDEIQVQLNDILLRNNYILPQSMTIMYMMAQMVDLLLWSTSEERHRLQKHVKAKAEMRDGSRQAAISSHPLVEKDGNQGILSNQPSSLEGGETATTTATSLLHSRFKAEESSSFSHHEAIQENLRSLQQAGELGEQQKGLVVHGATTMEEKNEIKDLSEWDLEKFCRFQKEKLASLESLPSTAQLSLSEQQQLQRDLVSKSVECAALRASIDGLTGQVEELNATVDKLLRHRQYLPSPHQEKVQQLLLQHHQCETTSERSSSGTRATRRFPSLLCPEVSERSSVEAQ